MKLSRIWCSTLALGVTASIYACCGFGSGGAPVAFTGQTNIVIWDKEHGIEHFVRDAHFESKGSSLGFLAPTPSEPTLSDADAQAFSLLASLKPMLTDSASKSAKDIPASAPGGVEVIREQDVAGYHAAVLRASDSKALTNWLEKNGYEKFAFFDEWAKPYLDKGWFFTAFKVVNDATGPVRMSFKTNTPFNPYRVPSVNKGNDNELKLYYVSATNEVPKIGGTVGWVDAAWSTPLPENQRTELASHLKLNDTDIPAGSNVTFYSDPNFGQSEEDDLFFVPNPASSVLMTAAIFGVVLVIVTYISTRKTRRTANA